MISICITEEDYFVLLEALGQAIDSNEGSIFCRHYQKQVQLLYRLKPHHHNDLGQPIKELVDRLDAWTGEWQS